MQTFLEIMEAFNHAGKCELFAEKIRFPYALLSRTHQVRSVHKVNVRSPLQLRGCVRIMASDIVLVPSEART